jgi:hypothetical protein
MHLLAHVQPCATVTPMRHLITLAFALGLLGACAAQTVDLGSNQLQQAVTPPDGDDASAPKSFTGCVAWNDLKVQAVRGQGCTTQNRCSASTNDVRPSLVTAEDVVAVTAGRWLFCRNDILSGIGTGGASQTVVGIEFQGGCVSYALVRDMDGALVRGTEAGDQGNFDIVLASGKPPQIILHTKFRGDFTLGIESASCPNNYLRLLDKDGRGLTMQSVGANPAR